MARGFSKRRLRRLPGRSPGTQRRGPRHRGRILSPQGGPRTIRAARTPTTQSQVMSKDSTGLPLTISLKIPAYWTPEQAFAVGGEAARSMKEPEAEAKVTLFIALRARNDQTHS